MTGKQRVPGVPEKKIVKTVKTVQSEESNYNDKNKV